MVPAVERAVRLLDALALARRPASLASLARILPAPKSSLHGLLATLVELDLVRRDEAGEFALGPRALQWAGAYSLKSDVVGAFHQHADRTAELASETVMLAVLDGSDVLYLACRPGSRALAVNFRVGGRYPACCTSSGKAMLANLNEAAVRSLYAGNRQLPRPTRHSVASLAALERQLAEVRRRGYAIDDEEVAEGMQCFGAPVFAAGSATPVAAVAVSLIKAGTGAARRAQVIAAVRALAAGLSARLGGAAPISTLSGQATARGGPTSKTARRAAPPAPGPSSSARALGI
jgi:DNA-binding IclR family transcriptional regulator